MGHVRHGPVPGHAVRPGTNVPHGDRIAGTAGQRGVARATMTP